MEKKSLRTLVAMPILGIALVGSAVFAQGTLRVETIEHEVAITGSALQSASEAALRHTGGGRVTDTEVGDEESYYEVEVTLDNGNQVDVQLDEKFTVVGEKIDTEVDDEVR